MALTGTLEDFGIAEILQLIGQQAKSGVLHLRSRDAEIHVLMADGAVVSAEHAGRKQRERLGALLVRARIITRADLERALDMQRRTLRRLGDVLVELGVVTKADLREMTALQTTETVYALFTWKSGTYAFEPGAVDWDRETVSPLRAESILMEGFRRIDEWPMVRRKISSPAMTFVRREPPGGPDLAEVAALAPGDRRVYGLAEPGRPLSTIVDLSRLGEFETCKSLLTLANLGLLEPIAPARRSAAAGVSAYARSWSERLRRGAAGLLATVALASAVAGVAWLASERARVAESQGGPGLRDRAAQRFLARYQLSRLAGAIEVWRLEHGEYPERLRALAEAELVRPEDLRYPYDEDYYYRRKAEGGFVLLPPLP
jgi:hypothetical protein